MNHQTGHQLRLELIDLPFPTRSYRVRVNGEWAKKLPVASKQLLCGSFAAGG